MATVHIPPQLVRFTDGARQVEIPGTTLREIVDALDERFPGIRDCHERWPFHSEPPGHEAMLSLLFGLLPSQSSILVPLHSTYDDRPY